MNYMQKYVFLDRDGTVIVEGHYLHRPEDVELETGVIEGLKRLQQQGFELVIVSNQSGIGRGYFGRDAVEAVHERIAELLRAEGIEIRDFLFCPHTPEEGCRCRKPGTELLERFAKQYPIDLSNSWVVGDRLCDVQLARNFNLNPVWIQNQRHPDEIPKCMELADVVANSFEEAAQEILG